MPRAAKCQAWQKTIARLSNFCLERYLNPDSKLTKSEPPEEQQQSDKLPAYPKSITNGKLNGFVDAAYVNDLSKQRSTTGYILTYSGGAVVY